MKLTKSLLLAGALSLLLVSCSGLGVPSAAKDALKRDFPSAERVEWEKTDTGLFEAEFVNGGVKTEAYYTPEGVRELTEEKLRLTQLPTDIQTQLRTLFPGQEIDDVIRRTDMDGGVFYAVEVNDLVRIFTADGTYLGPYDATMPQPAAPAVAATDSLVVDSL